MKDIFSNYVEAAGALNSSNRPVGAYRLLKKAMDKYPVKDEKGCWPEEAAKVSIEVVASLGCNARFEKAIALLEKVKAGSEGEAKLELERQIKVTKKHGVEYCVRNATELAEAHPTWTGLIMHYLNRAVKIDPERKEELDKGFVFLEGMKHSFIVTRERYERPPSA